MNNLITTNFHFINLSQLIYESHYWFNSVFNIESDKKFALTCGYAFLWGNLIRILWIHKFYSINYSERTSVGSILWKKSKNPKEFESKLLYNLIQLTISFLVFNRVAHEVISIQKPFLIQKPLHTQPHKLKKIPNLKMW